MIVQNLTSRGTPAPGGPEGSDLANLRAAAERAVEQLLGLPLVTRLTWESVVAADLSALAEHLQAQAPVVARVRALTADELLAVVGARSAAICPARGGWLVAAKRSVLLTAAGERSVPTTATDFRELLSSTSATGLVLEQRASLQALSASNIGSASPWTRLHALMRLEAAQLWPLVLYALAAGALSLALPVAIQVLVNTIALGALRQPLLVLTVLLFGFLCLSGLVQLVRWYAVEVLQRRLFVRIAEDFSRRLPNLEPQAPEAMNARDLSHRFFEVVTLQKSVGTLLLDGLGLVLQTVVSLLLLAFYHPVLLAFDVVLVLGLVTVLLLGRGAVSSATAESKAKYETASWLNAISAQPNAFESAEARRSAALQADALTRKYLGARRLHYRRLLRQLVGGVFVQVVSMTALLGVGGLLVMAGELTLGQLVAAELVVGAVGAGFVKLGKHLETGYDLLAGLDKLGQVLDLPQRSLESGHTTERADPTVQRQEMPSSALPLAGGLTVFRRFAWLVGFSCIASLLALWVVPWRQSVGATGRVVAYAPLDRQQTVEAAIEGRVVHWYVQEGDRVEKGDPIADLADNDPAILGRLERERDAARAQVDAIEVSVRLMDTQIASLEHALSSAVDSQRQQVRIAEERQRAAERALHAANATLRTAKLNTDRLRSLEAKGLVSRRDLELSELEYDRADASRDQAQASFQAAQAEVKAQRSVLSEVGSKNRAAIDSTRSSLEKVRADKAKAEAELTKVEVRLARQQQLQVVAPRSGVILRLVKGQGAEMVKAGDPLAILVPEAGAQAVELYVNGNDAPLLRSGQPVRLQFEGWPAVQFVGWPSVAVGTFAGEVAFVDAHGDERGRFRTVIVPGPNAEWPTGRYLRQGVRTKGWVLLNEVSIGFELWRQFNGFPPSVASHATEAEK